MMKTRKWTTKDLGAPLRWRKPYCVEVPDLFDGSRSNEEIAAVFGVMAAAPQHTFLLLTKQPERAVEWFRWIKNQGVTQERRFGDPYASEVLMQHAEVFGVSFPGSVTARPCWPLPNVWLGVSVEDQRTADERIPLLLQCPAAVRWVSAEPLLGPVDLTTLNDGSWYDREGATLYNALRGSAYYHDGEHGLSGGPRLDWLVVGGESGPGARPVHPDWVRSLRDQCAEAGVPFNFAGWGGWAPLAEDCAQNCTEGIFWSYDWSPGMRGQDVTPAPSRGVNPFWQSMVRVGKNAAGRTLDGVTHDGYPGVVKP